MNVGRRALFLNPSSPTAVFRDHYCSSEAKSTYLWHPLDLLIQEAHFRAAGWQTIPLDAIALQLTVSRQRELVRQLKAPVVVVLVSERTWSHDKQCLQWLRRSGADVIIASGDFLRFGTGPIAEAKGLVDWVLTDFTTPHVPQSLEAGVATGPGLCALDELKAKRITPLRGAVSYPPIDHRFFQSARYRLPYPGFTSFASLLTGYGCPFHCQYCHVGELGYRTRRVDEIVADVAMARSQGFQQIYFRDATINAKRGHLLSWCAELTAQGLAMPWAAFATARPFDEEVARAMFAAGCRHLQIGVETLNPNILERNGKPFDVEAHRSFVSLAHAEGIEVTAHVVLGLPGETAQTIEATVRGLASVGFDYAAVNIAEDRPGIPWRNRGVSMPVLLGGEADGIPGTALSLDELRRAQRTAYRRFYLRPTRLFKEAKARLRCRDVTDLVELSKGVAGWVIG